MSFLSPIPALIAASVVVPMLVALYFLKLRRRRVAVSTTLLWRKTIHDLQVNAPFQRIRRNLLLLLQLLLLAAMLFALARPTRQVAAEPGQRVVILIDHSASMNATDGSALGRTRLDRAQSAALEIIDQLDASAGGAMVVSFAEHAAVLQPFTNDPSPLRAAVRSVEPTDQRSRLLPALRLVELFVPQTADAAADSLVVYVLSDGRVQLPEAEALALQGAELRYVSIGEADTANAGIISLSARRDFDKPQIVQVFARLANFSDEPLETDLRLTVDGKLARVESVELPPAAPGADDSATAYRFSLLLPGSAMVELRMDHDDALSADNVARLVLAPARRLRVLLVTEGNAFLERAVRSAGVRELALMGPQKYADQVPETLARGGWDAAGMLASSDKGFDLIIFDRVAPSQVPPVPSLSFGSAPPIAGLKLHPPAVDDERGLEVVLDWQRDHPLMRYVALDDVLLRAPGRLEVPDDATVLATARAGPIIAEVADAAGRPHAVAAFNVLETNWPLYVGFPVFISNAVQTLGLGAFAEDAGVRFHTGEVAVIPDANLVDPPVYTGPASLTARLTPRGAVLSPFGRVGVYRTRDEVDPPYDRLPVNLLDALESDVRPADHIDIASLSVEAAAESATIRREIWPRFLWVALVVLLVEWLIYTRRMHL